MAYISLYRRFRPFTFDGVIGQEHIVRILRSQVKSGNISHAYLFTGTRGTGKTSVAKIFARAINCEHSADGSACGECATCKALAVNNLDIIEMDAASNNSVEEIRDIKESVKYPPVNGKYKVYIIDEVHMLTISAFNALLKTLEEPPEHIVFILATTEVHKLPVTILSRCLKFDFRLVPSETIAGLIRRIFDEIDVKYDDNAIAAIAEAGEGSVRDALSIADMCVSFGEGAITYNDVLEVLGASNPDILADIAGSTLEGDISTALTEINRLSVMGKSMSSLARDLAKTFRNIYFVKTVNNSKELLKLPDDVYNKLLSFARYDNGRILRCIEILSGVEGNIRYSAAPRIIVEAAVARAADISASGDVNSLLLRVKALESGAVKINGAPSAASKQEIIPLESRSVYGYLLRELRSRGMIILREQINELDEGAFKSDADKLIIETGLNSVFKALSEAETKAQLLGVLKDRFIVSDIEVRRIADGKDLAGDIDKVKSLFDKDLVIVNKN